MAGSAIFIVAGGAMATAQVSEPLILAQGPGSEDKEKPVRGEQPPKKPRPSSEWDARPNTQAPAKESPSEPAGKREPNSQRPDEGNRQRGRRTEPDAASGAGQNQSSPQKPPASSHEAPAANAPRTSKQPEHRSSDEVKPAEKPDDRRRTGAGQSPTAPGQSKDEPAAAQRQGNEPPIAPKPSDRPMSTPSGSNKPAEVGSPAQPAPTLPSQRLPTQPQQTQTQPAPGRTNSSDALPPPPDKVRDAQEFIQRDGSPDRRKIEDVRKTRVQERDRDRIVIREGDRTLIREGSRTIVRHNESARFAVGAGNVRTARRGENTETIVERGNGVRIISVIAPDGRLVQRIRRDRNGRDIVIIDNTFDGPRQRDMFISVEPPAIRIPRERYVVDMRKPRRPK